MGLPARQRRFEADAQKRPHVARLAEEQRRAEQQPELHAVRVAELESRKHGERAPRRPLREGRAGPEVGGALDREVDTDLALARLGAEVGERQEPGVPAQSQPEHEAACAAENRAFVDKRAEPRGERRHAHRPRAHRAGIADVGRFDLPPAAERPREPDCPRTAPLRAERRGQSHEGRRHCEDGQTHVRAPHRRHFGRAAGVFLEAEFLSASETGGGAPQAAISVTIYPDRYLPTVKGIRFFQAPEAAVLAGEAPLVALVNGYHSWSPCQVVKVSATTDEGLASHGALGLTRGGRGLALAFDPGEPGEAAVQLAREGLEAGSAG